jgi:PhzF family phenazine biosynthesis protein
MTAPRHFHQLDVFTAEALRGNPLAVVHAAQGLSDARMAAFARWTNLSETTFLLPPTDPEADYRVRIFTPGGELQFAGHPTLGSCHAWLEAGGQPRTPGQVVQQCGVGLVRLRRGAAQLAFAAPPLQRSPASTTLLARVAAALGIAPAQLQTAQMLDNGTAWLGLLLDDPRTVLALQPDFAALAATGQKVGVAARYPQPAADGPHLEVRGFAPHLGVNEDPVTGSLNASLAQWLMAEGLVPETYVAAQGHCLQRAGRVQLQRDGAGQVWVGGRSVTCVAGTVRL